MTMFYEGRDDFDGELMMIDCLRDTPYRTRTTPYNANDTPYSIRNTACDDRETPYSARNTSYVDRKTPPNTRNTDYGAMETPNSVRDTPHDRNVRAMDDPDWLQIVGHPTIPHNQSLRAPPANVALHPKKERLLGFTNKDVSKRYLDRLQKDRVKNKQVLVECVDNLPITIKQIVYPEKPKKSRKTPLVANGNLGTADRFRLGTRPVNDYWQDTRSQHWSNISETGNAQTSPRQQGSPNRKTSQLPPMIEHKSDLSRVGSNDTGSTLSKHSEETTGKFVHHQGFQGMHSQPHIKHAFGKTYQSSKSSSTASTVSQAPFKPKGFGTLYDEMEFQRRYKKVFDLNKHIHFVHSNFLSGQRIVKRTKLPPIGTSGVQSEPPEQMDIFAIMSVQKYNHPEGGETPTAPHTTPGLLASPRKGASGTEEGTMRNSPRFVPSVIRDPFRGMKAAVSDDQLSKHEGPTKGNATDQVGNDDVHYRLSAYQNEDLFDMTGNGIEHLHRVHEDGRFEDCRATSHNDVISKLSKNKGNTRSRSENKHLKMRRKRDKNSDSDNISTGTDTDTQGEDLAPFNISVHVEIKQKDTTATEVHPVDVNENDSGSGQATPIAESRDSDTPSSDVSGTGVDVKNSNYSDKPSSEKGVTLQDSSKNSQDSNTDKMKDCIVREDDFIGLESETMTNNTNHTKDAIPEIEDKNYLRVPSTPDSKPPSTPEDTRVKVLSRGNSCSSGHSLPEIRMTSSTPCGSPLPVE